MATATTSFTYKGTTEERQQATTIRQRHSCTRIKRIYSVDTETALKVVRKKLKKMKTKLKKKTNDDAAAKNDEGMEGDDENDDVDMKMKKQKAAGLVCCGFGFGWIWMMRKGYEIRFNIAFRLGWIIGRLNV